MADDRELWERICSGDSRAFEAFYRETAPRLQNFLRHLLPAGQAAEDVTQDTFLQMWRRSNGFRPERGSLPAYAFGIGRKRAADRHTGFVSRKDGDGTIIFGIRFADLSAGMEKLSVRSLWIPGRVDGVKAYEQAKAQPERELWFTPGEKLSIPVEGYGAIEVTGEFLEKLPEDLRTGMYPREESFRIVPSVFCLSGDRVLSRVDFGGGEFSREEHYLPYHFARGRLVPHRRQAV